MFSILPKKDIQYEREKIGLMYREGKLSPSHSEPSKINAILSIASNWKLKQVVFEGQNLNAQDINYLQNLGQYPEIVDLLLKDKNLLEDFFKWGLLNHLSLEIYIQFPKLQRNLVECNLSYRIGRLGGNQLKLQEIEGENQVTLPIEGKEINILDENRYVILRGNYILSIKEIFEEFNKKSTGSANLEWMENGIINWNTLKWGSWNDITKEYELVDFSQKDWWKQLPQVEVLTLKQARKKYGTHLDGTNWNLAAVSTRTEANLDFEGTHSYTSLVVPIGEGRYAVYSIGKSAVDFAPTPLKAFKTIAATVEASLAYPDENVFYTQREKMRVSFPISEQQAMLFLNSVKRDMLLAREGHFVYQIQTENCAKWVFEKLRYVTGSSHLPEVFKMPFLASTPKGIMGKIFGFLRSLPEKLQVPIVTTLHLAIGASKGKWVIENKQVVWKSMTYHRFWKDLSIFHPSMLFKSVQEGVIKRVMTIFALFVYKHWKKLHIRMVRGGKIFLDLELIGRLNLFLTFLKQYRGFRGGTPFALRQGLRYLDGEHSRHS